MGRRKARVFPLPVGAWRSADKIRVQSGDGGYLDGRGFESGVGEGGGGCGGEGGDSGEARHESSSVGGDATTREECVRSLRQRPANDLKVELKALRLHAKGRKPDLVQHLADHYFGPAPVVEEDEKEEEVEA